MTTAPTDDLPDLRRLQSLIVLAEEQHFGRAAKRLGISQPSLSSQIRLLEDHLGLILFDRDSRNVRLTDSGMAVVDEAKALLAHARMVSDSLRAGAATTATKPLRGGGDFVCPLQITPALVAANREVSGGEFTLQMRTDIQPNNVAAVERGELDFALFWRSHDLTVGLPWIHLVDVDLGIVCAEPHPLSTRAEVSLAELGGTQITVPPDADDPFLRAMDTEFRRIGARPAEQITGRHPSDSVPDILAGRIAVYATRLHTPKEGWPVRFVRIIDPAIPTAFVLATRPDLPAHTADHLANMAARAGTILAA